MIYKPDYIKDYGKGIDFYSHQHSINENAMANNTLYPNTNPSTELHSGIYMVLNNYMQDPVNFLGIRHIRPNGPDLGKYALRQACDISGIPVMRGEPIQKHYNVVC